MNSLTKCNATELLLHSRFHAVIVTDIVRKDGENAQMVTMVSHSGMFDETVMGINKSLRSGGKALKWQSRVYSFRDGQLTAPITYKPICLNETNG